MSDNPTPNGFFTSELGLRIISAVVLVIFVLVVSGIGGWPFTVMSVALSAVLFYEWQKIVSLTPFDTTEALLTLGFVGLLVSALTGFLAIGIVVFLALGLVLEVTSHGAEQREVRWIGLGALYCAVPAVAFPLILQVGGLPMLLFLFIAVWVTDIAAYFAGRQFGGPKLFAAVSPKKTWSGAIGGFVCAGIAGGLVSVSYVSGFEFGWVVLACGLSIASQVGDLFESWVKRVFGVKDSSQLIPGHGGFLDRVDGLVAAAIPLAIMFSLSIA